MQRDVARQLGLNESAVTAMANRLLGLDLLERQRDAADARAWRLSLTRAGRGALKRIEKPFRGINETVEATLTPEEVGRLGDYLARIAAAFDPR